MNTIKGGVISVEDGVKKTEECAPARKVRVELHFDVPEGSDATAYIDGVAAQADAKVKELLGQKTTVVRGATAAEAAAAPKPAGKTKADLAAEAGVGDAQVEAVKPRGPARAPKAVEQKVDPAAIVDEDILPGDFNKEFEIPGTDVALPISDDEVNAFVGKVNGKLGDPPKIREVIVSFKPEGWTKQFTLRDIPQAQRQAFKDKLKALLPAEQQKGL